MAGRACSARCWAASRSGCCAGARSPCWSPPAARRRTTPGPLLLAEPAAAPLAEPIDYARQDLAEAARVVLRREGHLLTAGERRVIQGFLDLPADVASLYARLFGRQPQVFLRAGLSYAEIPDLERAA